MLDAYDLDVLGSEARGLRFFVGARIPKEEWHTNEDMKKLLFINQEVVKSKFAPYLEYGSIRDELAKIHDRYLDMPDLGLTKMKVRAEQMHIEEKSAA